MVGALIVAAITAFMARSLIAGHSTPVAGAQVPGGALLAPAPTGPEVLVATKALPVGTILDPESMKFQPWPKELVQNAYFIKGDKNVDVKTLQGTVVRFAIPAGQPVTQGSLVKPGDRGFLAAALGPGMRAVTVPVAGANSVAGFVFPGDRVDLMLTQDVPGGGDGPPLKVSETVLRNLRVLATDQRTDKQTDDKGKTVVATYSTVTVEATPKIAEKIAVVQSLGSLSLSLRSIADNAHELDEAIASGDVSVPDGNDAKADKKLLAAVAARPNDSGSTFTTGADVSRFRRSTVPGKPSESNGPAVAPGAPTSGIAGSTPIGPVVRIARGNNVTIVPLAGKN
jgi:pilus assembly protein CpaB